MKGRGGLFGVVALIAASGGLYTLKYDVAARETELVRLDIALAETKDAIHVLRTEWAYLNQPQRLASLVADRLDLGPVTGAQMISLDTAFGTPAVGGRIESVELLATRYSAVKSDASSPPGVTESVR